MVVRPFLLYLWGDGMMMRMKLAVVEELLVRERRIKRVDLLHYYNM